MWLSATSSAAAARVCRSCRSITHQYQLSGVSMMQQWWRRSLSAAAADTKSTRVPHLRRRMIPLIKRVHPDFFSQEAPIVRATNEASLQKLNEVLDICQHRLLETADTPPVARLRTKLAARYTLSFYHFAERTAQTEQQEPEFPATNTSRSSEEPELTRFTCDLEFPADFVSRARNRAFRAHVEMQLDKLLVGGGLGSAAGAAAAAEAAAAQARADEALRRKTGRSAEELRELRAAQARATKVYHQYICTLTSGRAPVSPGANPTPTKRVQNRGRRTVRRAAPAPPAESARVLGAFGAEDMGVAGAFGGGYAGSYTGGHAGVVDARRASDYLRSGRVLFQSVSLTAQARALRRLHALLTAHADALALHDAAAWDETALVLTASAGNLAPDSGKRRSGYAVRPVEAAGGRKRGAGVVLLAPANFDDREMREFLEEAVVGRARARAARRAARVAASAEQAARGDTGWDDDL